MILYDRNTGADLGRAKITAIEGNTVRVDKRFAGVDNALAEWPEHECAGWIIQNCTWSDNYQRLLIQSGPGTIRNCRFTRFGSAIQLNSVMPFVEGGVPHDIRIENNVFTDINPQAGSAAIMVYAHAFQRDKAPTLRKVVIIGNTFNRPVESSIGLGSVEGVIVEKNRFETTR